MEAWGGIRQAITLPTPHPDPLSQGKRGSNRSLRGWRAKPRRGPRPRALHGEAMPWRRGAAFARQCRYPPLTLALSPKGRGEQTEVAEAGGRNPVEGSALVSCTAKPCHGGVGRHSPGNAVTHPSPSPARGEGSKPKSPRLAGETPSRTESSRPARRSRAIQAWSGNRQAMTLPTPSP